MLQTMETLSKSVTFSDLSVLDVGTGSGILAILWPPGWEAMR